MEEKVSESVELDSHFQETSFTKEFSGNTQSKLLSTDSSFSLCTDDLQSSVTSSPSTIVTQSQSFVPSLSQLENLESTDLPLKHNDPVLHSQMPQGALEEHLLMLHVFLENPSSEELYGDVVKTVNVLQAALKIAGKVERHLFLSVLGNKDSNLISRLVCVMEISNDPVTVGAICGLIHECLAPTCDGNIRHQLIKCLVSSNAAEALFRCFRNFPVAVFGKGDVGLVHGFQVIAKLSSKDAKMAVKCRLVGGVKLTHQLIQAHSKNNFLLLPLLLVLKFIAKNPTNQVVLGKDGCVTTLISLLNTVPKSHWAKIKLILENLALLTKTKSNVIRVVRENGVLKLISLLELWEKMDKRHQNKILRSLLFVLSHLCDSKHGRKAVLSLNGDEILHKFIISCPADPRFDAHLGIALNVFLKCSAKGELPVMSLKGAISFKSSSREISPQPITDSREMTPDLDQESSDEEEYGEDDDDELDSKGIDLATSYNPQTTRLEDLIKMAAYFPELHEADLEKDVDAKVNVTKDESSFSDAYLHQSSSTKTLIHFVKVAYPDMIKAEGPTVLEPLYQKNSKVIREKALRTVDRVLNAESYQEKVVFDLDYLLESDHSRQITPTSPPLCNLSNWDEKRVGKKDIAVNHLNFESRFESGNLRRAIQIAPYEYDLLLNSDVNSWHHHQWFYFEVSNMEAGVPYIINIINNEKPNSEFNFGMKPVIFSVKESMLGRSAWVRTGYDICYHKNHFARLPKNSENTKFRRGTGKSYYTVSMTIKFPHANDVVYLAYHYPYTFTKLQTFLSTLESEFVFKDIFYRNQTFCHTLNGNSVPLLTITNKDRKSKDKEVIFLTARVHPGESNSSWVIEGMIRFLLSSSEEAKALRNEFVFKIVPMLNPEGVIHGNQRCGLTDEDLNRRWKSPNPLQHPTIYYTKALIEHLTAVIGKRPLIFCDFHGHSRQKNVFMYGCSGKQSWWLPDRDLSEDGQFMVLPRLAQLHMRTFSLSDCRFDVERSRESTARVAIWRQFQVKHSYTMEASTCGCDRGPYQNYHLSPKLLLSTGEGFCYTLYHFGCQNHSLSKSLITNRLSWTNSVMSTTDTHETSKTESEDVDFDSEDDLDFELYGISTKKGKVLDL